MTPVRKSFVVYRCEDCGRIHRHGKWLFIKELRPDVAETFKRAIEFGYIDWNYRRCSFCQEDVL